MSAAAGDFALWLLNLGVVTTIAAEPAPAADAQLVARARQDLRAFKPLYDRHVTAVYRYLLARAGNVEDAQDLTSQTFLAAMEGLATYDGRHPFPAWLFGIARHKAADHFRRKRPQTSLADTLPDPQPAPDDMAGQTMQIEQVARKLQIIAPDRAEAVRLRFFAGLEVKTIAAMMNKQEPAVRMLVHSGLNDLQRQLQPVLEEQA